ncbi:60S ribosome subunit biogenesis protein NIP7 homolog [Drosophila madeirensis]|uniref:60S ribosome subunit biogenesis protein NIP7 homolog n=3 Tax=obscura subgroup TaxID=32357 RepID=A0A3B0JHG7_DROGU|nr:60S ribosome subunit biogenesis protein NIP7 homolog [Drosophila guanche]XP_034665122.1 60S ribosome subunit biogenesis protein NIP7 homolog [Drosophila subobscura]SPP80153.1 blast:60S ribosome subunit biogenesis protein NIP7 homolog [Drosophila guanche]
MKRLSDERAKILFEKLNKYIGTNVTQLIDRPDGTYCFREMRDRVYYVSERILKLSECFSGKQLVSVGTCFGKFSKTNKLKFHITALYYLAPYAQHKVWVKPSFEQQYLYGNNVPKSGLARITENAGQYQGVVVYSMSDLPLGFGVLARSTTDCKTADPLTAVCYHQSDLGEYIRAEDSLF